jgi:RNA polymerase sigma-70 factor (ECF subfamily)
VNEDQFQKVVEQHYDRLFRAARFMCADEHAAEDLVHETFLAAAESFSRFRGRSTVYTWLYGIMLNKLRRWIRRRRRSTVSLQQLSGDDPDGRAGEVLPADGPLPFEEVERRERAERVRRAMAELPEDQRSVIALRFVDGLSYQEIGEMLECPLGTVKSRIHYALRKIAASLEGGGEGE